MPGKRSALLSFIILILSLPDLFSQATTISGWRHSDFIYCASEGGDSIIGASPSGKEFYFDGVSYYTSPALVRTDDGEAIFYPNQASAGTHTIKYGNIGWHEVTVVVTIQAPVVATLSPFANVCSTTPSFSLFNSDSSNVSPKNGHFSGPGVDASGIFSPASAGPGVHMITYTAGVGSCLSSVSRQITVIAAPVTQINPFPPVCEGTPPFVLTQGFPAGGTYSGPGTDVSGLFDQSATGIGSFPITYTYSNGICTNSATRNIIVAQRPIASFAGLGAQYCNDNAGVNLIGNPVSITGIFTGPGITDNGNGNALFEPVMAGLGLHQIRYIYTSPEGCADTAIQQVQVGTDVIISGLAAQYCINSADVSISATPVGGAYSVTPGLTDNGDGTAAFSPSAAGTGMHTISYTYADANGCINTRSVQVRVYSLPVPSIQNLAAAYCANNPSLIIRGNYQPSGTFSGPGLTDRGDGTAVFNPSLLIPGNSYPLTYNYTDALSGCSASVTNNVLINPLPASTLTGNADICHGTAANLSIAISGSGPFTVSMSDGTGTYTYNNVAGPVYNIQLFPSDTITYTLSDVTDSKGCSSAGNGVAIINVLPEVGIVTQPVSQHVCPGSDISFSVSATGVDLHYQWEKDGVAIGGATNTSIILNDVQPADIGAYRCIISGDCGIDITSNEAFLRLWSPVQLLAQPADIYECEGANAILRVLASGSNLSYQWYRNNVPVHDEPGYVGTSASDFHIGPLLSTMAGNYHVTVTGTCGTVNSNSAIVKVDRNITINSHPQDANVCEGINAVFSVSATGDNLSYEWQLNGAGIPGETATVLTIPNSSAADEGFYRCVVRSGCGSEIASNSALLSVQIKPAITANPVSLLMCEDNNAVFRVTASGSDIGYQWTRNGIALTNNARISGVTGSTLSITGVTGGDIGDYACMVYNTCDSIRSATASLSVDTSLFIIAQPQSQRVCNNNNVLFSITASGNNLTYQWFRDGMLMPGKTGNILVINSITAADAAVYHCTVSNSCGQAVNSAPATLTVDLPATITGSPLDVHVCEGDNAIFNISASGSSLTYQWEYNGVAISDAGNVSGTGTNTLMISPAGKTHEGVYNCLVQGSCGTQRSVPAGLLVSDTLIISEHPANVTVCEGNNAQFRTSADGAAGYQWQKNKTDIPGATGASLIIVNVSNADSGVYRCIVYSVCDTLSTDGASLIIKKQPQITLQPVPVNSCEDLRIQFEANATGSDITWKWFKDGSPLNDGNGINGSGSSLLIIDSVKTIHEGVYSTTITGYCGDISSNPALLTVNSWPVILQQPQSSVTCENQTASFSVAVLGDATYQWQKDNINLPAQTSESLILTNISDSDAAVYRCRITGDCGYFYTNGALLTVNRNPVITEHPVDVTACEGNLVIVSTGATGTDLKYHWKHNGGKLTDDAYISGSTGPVLNIQNSAMAHKGLYQCEVTGVCGTVTGNSASVDIKEKIQIIEQPVSSTRCQGKTASFRILATGSNITYQWQKDGVDIAVANSAQFDIASVLLSDTGIYRCVINGACGQVISEEARLTVDTPPVITTQPPAEMHICSGNMLTAGFTAKGTVPSYQWFRNGGIINNNAVISGSDRAFLTINPAEAAYEGIYYCEVSNSCSTTATNGMQVWIDEPAFITEQPQNAAACTGEDVIMSITATGDNISHQWRKNGSAIAGANNPVYTISNAVLSDSGSYQCVITSACGQTISDAIQVQVFDPPVIVASPPAFVSQCEGMEILLNVSVSGNVISYQWKKNGISLMNVGNISGSGSPTLRLSNVSASDEGVYTCEITGNCNKVTTPLTTVDVGLKPFIVFDPADYSVLNAGNALFSSTVGGDITSYKWYFNGSPLADGGGITGTNSSLLQITGVSDANEGAYNIEVSGPCGSATGQPALLTILTSSLITGQPAGAIKCEGESMTFSIETSGTGHTYQWKKDGSVLPENVRFSGIQQAELSITGLIGSDAGAYSCVIDGIENSVPAILYVNKITDITYLAGANDLCSDEAILVFAEASGDSLHYSWYKDGSELTDNGIVTGSSTQTLVIQPASSVWTGSYTCLVNGACGTETSDPLVITVSDPVNITKQPADTSVCEGQPVSLSASATGTSISWQWYKNGQPVADDATISGAKNHTLLISDAGISDEGSYYCIIEGPCNRVYTNSAEIHVNRLVEIISQPANANECLDDLAVLSITTNLSNAGYRWQKEGLDLEDNVFVSGSTTNTLRIGSLQLTDNGIYKCIVSGSCNSVASNPVLVNVYEKTTILSHPAGGTICEGTGFSFSVAAAGSSLTYNWFKDGTNLSDGVRYSGTQTQMLVINSAGPEETGTYYCVVSGTCGTLTTNYAILNVNSTTRVDTNPPAGSICEGNDLSLSVSASGTALSYQWQKDNNPLFEGLHYSGTGDNDLHILNASPAESGTYQCIITGACGTVVSTASQLKVITPPSVTVSPNDTNLCEGDNLLLKIVADGDELVFGWKFNNTQAGSATDELFVQDITSSHDGIYTCMVSNVCGSANSDPAVISVNRPGQILKSPVDVARCLDEQANFTVEATGDNLVYSWEFNGTPLSDGLRLAGSSTRTLVISNLQNADQGTYRCVIKDACGNVLNSDAAALAVHEPVTLDDMSPGDTLCEGQSVTLSVMIGGSNPVFQWYRNGTKLTEGADITGVNTASLNIQNAQTGFTGHYTCEITGSCGHIVTPPIPVLVTRVIRITEHPVNLTRCAGENAVFSVTVQGDSLTYQWMKDSQALVDGAGISGSKSSLLLLTGLTSAESGSYYCVIRNSCSTENSHPASLLVNDYPDAAGMINGETIVCQGRQGQVYEIAAIPFAENYRWTLPPGMVVVTGQNTRQITVNFGINETGGPVYVEGINTCGAGPSSPVLLVTVNQLPVAYAGENTGICSNETVLTAFDPGLPSTGLWQVISGPAVVDQPTHATTAVTALRNGENRFVWTVTSNGCALSDTVTINNNMLHVEAGNDTSLCSHIYSFNAQLPGIGTGKWSIVSGAGYNIDRYNPNSIVSGLARGVNIFKWSVINNGCTSYDTVKITNNLPSDADAGNDQFLQSDYTNLSGNIPQTGTGEWTLINGSAVISDPEKYNTLVTNLGQGQNLFEWTITHMGCISGDTVIITNSVTDSTEAGPNQVICSNVLRLNAKNPYPGYGEWSVKRGAATFANNSDFNTYAYNLMQGENVLVWTQYLNGVTSDSVVIINNLPTTANAGVNLSVCYDSVMLNANMPYIGTGVWSIISGAASFENGNANSTLARGLARGRNDFKWTITNGSCTSSSMVTVTNNRPSDAEAGFDVITCEDSIVLNPNVPTFGTGEWSVSEGSAKFSGNISYSLGRDDNELVYSIRQSGCYSRDTVIITSHKPSQARLGPDQSICRDSSMITANVPITGSGIWSLQSGSAILNDIHAPSAIAENIGPGENIFRWTVNYLECSSYDEMVISNDFVKADAGIDQVLCSERTILEANDPGYSTGVWTVIGGTTGASILDPHASNSTVENLAEGVNILRWTISKNTCKSYDEVVITNNSPTTAFAGENSFLCVDELKLRANPVTFGTGTWTVLSGSGSLTDIHDPVATISGLAPGINVLRWSTENEGCISTDEVIVSNNLPINVYAGLDQVLCDDSTALYANPPVIGTGIWSILQGSASFAQPDRYNTGVVRLGYGVNRLRWTVSTTGCSVTDTVEITNNLPSTAIAGSDFPVCNSTGNLSANAPLYGTGLWSLVSGAGTIADRSSPHTVIEDLALGNNTLQWSITNGNCVSSDQLIITNNSPTVADAGESSEVCGETAILYANFPVVGTGYWSVISGTGVLMDSLSFNTTVNGLNFGENTLRWTTRNGNCFTSDEISITNNLAYVYAGEDKVVYEPRTTLSGNNPGMGDGHWLLIAGAGNIGSADNFTTEVTEVGAGLNTYEWTITNGNCIARDQAVIHFKIMPQVGFMASVTEGCPGLTVDFVNTTRYGTTYSWDMGDGTVSSDVNPRHTYLYADRFVVKLTAFGPDNRQVVEDTVITIHPKPVADFQFAPDTAFVNNPVRFYNISFAGASSWLWDFSDSEFSTEENPVHHYRDSGNYDVRLIVNTGYGCSDTITKTLTVTEDGIIIFPNAFTPNPNGPNGGAYNENDFSNDVFHPYYENVSEYHLEIYSRWGVQLFETNDIRTGWDGYYKGDLLARDVYVWKVSGKYASGTQFLKTGNVILIRME